MPLFCLFAVARRFSLALLPLTSVFQDVIFSSFVRWSSGSAMSGTFQWHQLS
uniref:Uncharacterized protein n=1 Tax=Arundo donax TaxID=35708 RepID=A0A0A9FMC6_ARUDO